MRLSIVHALAPAPFGGLETVLRHLATGLQAAGEDVTVAPILSPGDAEEHPFLRSLEQTGVRLEPLLITGRGYLAERRGIRELLQRVRADVLHTHGYRPDVVDSGVAARAGIPRVTTVHGFTGGGRKNRLYEALQRRTFRRFDAVVAVSAKLEAELESLGEERDELQRRVDGFDQARHGYTELGEWTEALEALGAKIDAVEEKWLALAERA